MVQYAYYFCFVAGFTLATVVAHSFHRTNDMEYNRRQFIFVSILFLCEVLAFEMPFICMKDFRLVNETNTAYALRYWETLKHGILPYVIVNLIVIFYRELSKRLKTA